MKADQPPWRGRLARSYDAYFLSGAYAQRYPAPNPRTLEFLWQQGLVQAGFVLDLGCGHGRYALPVLERGVARILGCDISAAAIGAFEQRLRGHPARSRVDLLVGGVEALPAGVRFDRILMLFGVLSHIGPRAVRIDTLRQLRSHAHAGTALLLTVPNVWRRMPAELLGSLRVRNKGSWGDIEFHRVFAGQHLDFSYHLYGVRDLRRELAEAGWLLHRVEAECVLPEKLVCRSAVAARIDRVLQSAVPPAFGYGLRAVAHPSCDVER